MVNTDKLVPYQVPEFVRNDYSKFIDFLRAYYSFLKQYDLQITSLRDPDLTADNLVLFLKQEFANKFPKALIDDRKLIKTIREIYRSKGTINAVKLLFRLFYNESIKVTIPNEFILRSSDGVWEQFSFITVQQTYLKAGYTLDLNTLASLRIENDKGIFFVDIEKAEEVSAGIYRFYFRPFKSVPFDPIHQTVDYFSESGELLFRGLLIKQPSRLSIKNPGQGWKRGQIFTIKGTKRDTICKITSVGSNGQIESAEIIDYGFEHSENQVSIVSPYNQKPSGSDITIDKEIIGYNPFTETFSFKYTVSIGEAISSAEETFSARTYDTSNFFRYNAEDYFAEFYNASDALYNISFISSFGTSPANFIQSDNITVNDWFNSLATVVLNYDYETKLPGRFLSDRGFISSPVSRLQDNYFYQLFSYVIESTKSINEYRKLINEIHPAGLKFFAELAKTAIITFGDINISRTLSRSKIYLDDATDGAEDVIFKTLIKYFAENISTADLESALINKNIAETQVIGDGIPSAPIFFTYNAEDYFAEIYSLTDVIITIGDGKPSAPIFSPYNAEVYFAESYSLTVMF